VSDVASDLANRGSQLASSAGDQAKTFATELEGMARWLLARQRSVQTLDEVASVG
jgi:hypothetical protein